MRWSHPEPSLRRRMAARTPIKRKLAPGLGLLSSRGWEWLTSAKQALHRRVYVLAFASGCLCCSLPLLLVPIAGQAASHTPLELTAPLGALQPLTQLPLLPELPASKSPALHSPLGPNRMLPRSVVAVQSGEERQVIAPLPRTVYRTAQRQEKPAVTFQRVVVDNDPPRQPYYKMVGDVTGDGQNDIVIAGRAGPIVMYSGRARTRSLIADGGFQGGVNGELADIDGDGRLDIVMGGVVWFQNPGLAGGEWAVHRIDDQNIHDVEVADLNGDGRPDVVCRDQSAFGRRGNEIFIYYQVAADNWKKERIECPHGEGLKVADLNADGKPDIVIGGIWYQNGSSAWSPHKFSSDWVEPDTKVEVGDLNGDGRLDVVLTPAELKGERYKISWFESPAGDPSELWQEHVIVPDVECVIHSLALGDYDRDSSLDVAYAEMHQGADPDEVVVMLNGGQGQRWSKLVIDERGSHDIVTADLDGDGDLDIVGANHAEVHPVIVWENRLAAPPRRSR